MNEIRKYTFINNIKSRNPVAKELRDPRFRKQIVRNRKQYTRKSKYQIEDC